MTPAPIERTAAAPAPDHAAFDRAAVAILGAMLSLIAALTVTLLQASTRPDAALPVAASAALPPHRATP